MDNNHQLFKYELKNLNEKRPKSDKSFDEGRFDLKLEIENILKDGRFHFSKACAEDPEFVKLWSEYTQLVQDFENCFEFMISHLNIKFYSMFINYSSMIEKYRRNFSKCLALY